MRSKDWINRRVGHLTLSDFTWKGGARGFECLLRIAPNDSNGSVTASHLLPGNGCFHCKVEGAINDQRTQKAATDLSPSTVRASDPNRCTLVVPSARA